MIAKSQRQRALSIESHRVSPGAPDTRIEPIAANRKYHSIGKREGEWESSRLPELPEPTPLLSSARG